MVVMISRMSTYVKTYQNVYLKYVYCIVGLLYLNKDVNKMKKAGRDLSWKGIDGQVAGSTRMVQSQWTQQATIVTALLMIQHPRRQNLIG